MGNMKPLTLEEARRWVEIRKRKGIPANEYKNWQYVLNEVAGKLCKKCELNPRAILQGEDNLVVSFFCNQCVIMDLEKETITKVL